MDYFTKDEFKCPCCNDNEISSLLAMMLDDARREAGIPFSINSGYRCEHHNNEVGGSASSSHLLGLAADIRVSDNRSRFLIMRGLIVAGFDRIGVDSTFIHADVDSEKPRPRVWTY